MIKIYIMLIIVGVLAGVGAGAKYYYDSTQATIATLRENNAQLQIAADTAMASVETLKGDIKKMSDLNNKLQNDLQKAEAYGDELRGKLSRLNLVVEALKDSKVLEGKMNGATAKLWRNFMADTGNPNKYDLPSWLQSPTGTGDQNSSEGGENSDTNSSASETATTE